LSAKALRKEFADAIPPFANSDHVILFALALGSRSASRRRQADEVCITNSKNSLASAPGGHYINRHVLGLTTRL
jgi:hypothetical protein